MAAKVYEKAINEKINRLRERNYANPLEGEKLAEEIRIAAEKLDNDPFLMGNYLSSMAEFAYMKEDSPDQVFKYGIDSIPYLETAGDALGLSRTYNILAIQYYLRGFMIGAMENFLKSLSYSKQIENGAGHIGVRYLNIANVYHAMGDNETALEYAHKCIPLLETAYTGAHKKRNLTLAYALTGFLYMILGTDLKEAQKYSKKSLHLLKDFSLDEFDAPFNECWLLQAMIEKHKGSEDGFCRVIDQVLDRLERFGIHGDEIDTIADLLDYLTQVKEVEYVEKLSAYYDEVSEEISSGYRVRLLSDKLQCARYKGDKEEAARLALLYYDTAQEQDRKYREASLHSVRETKVMDEIRQENKRLAELAETDALTGLPNRFSLNKYSDALFEKAYKNKTSLAVEILDVDYFKQYNDTLGHQAGDHCLTMIASVIKELTEEDERIFAARYGGDEFVILYDGMEDEEILRYTELLRSKVKALALKHPATEHGYVSVTQGVRNSVPKEKNKLWDYMFTADNALYEAKKEHKGEIMLMKKASVSEKTFEKAILF